MNFFYKNLNEERYSKSEAAFYEYKYYFGDSTKDKVGKTIYDFYHDDVNTNPLWKSMNLNHDVKKTYKMVDESIKPMAKYVIDGRCPEGYSEKQAGYLLVARNNKLCPEYKLDSIVATAITTSLIFGAVDNKYLKGFIIGGVGVVSSIALCNFFEPDEAKEQYYEWTRMCLVNDEG